MSKELTELEKEFAATQDKLYIKDMPEDEWEAALGIMDSDLPIEVDETTKTIK